MRIRRGLKVVALDLSSGVNAFKFALVLSLAVSSCWAEEPLLTFVLAGQSNMVGKRCKYVELSPDLQAANDQAHFFNADRGEWIPLEPGQTQPEGFGPEIAFGKKMAELIGQPIGIIKHSRGGTNLAKQWDPDSPNSLFAQLKAQVDAARKTRDIRVVGMLWVQGGADAKDEEMSRNYSKNLRGLIESSREDFGNAEMVFLSGRIPVKNSKTKPHWRMVRAAQQDLEMADYAWVNCDDIRVGPDKIHYDTAGMTQLGERQATMMAARLTEKMAGTRMLDGEPGKIDFAKLPRVPAEHAIISDVRDRAGTWVHQHAYLARHGDRFWTMWSDGPGVPQKGVSAEAHRNRVPGHDRPDTRVSYATSKDGVNWSEPATLSGPPRIEGFGWIARGFWVRDQQLLALATHFNAPGYPGEGLSLEAFRWDEAKQSWVAHGTVMDDAMNNFPPKQLPNGKWMMTRRDHQRQVSVIVGGVEAYNDWEVHEMASYDGNGRPEEPYWYVLPDGNRLVGLIRDNGGSKRLLRTFSTDNGRSWTPISKTNFPDATSKFYVHRTSRDYYVMVSNANPKKRDPLILAISDDGLVFTDLFFLVGDRHIDYPHIIEHDGHLLVAFSGAKQTMEVMKVSLDQLEELRGN